MSADATLRAGALVCVCPEDGGALRPLGARALGLLGLGFALAALSQALGAGILPLAAVGMGAKGLAATAPYGAMLVGIGLSGFPGALLVDRLGRREGLALGASLGVAGGLLVALAIVERHYPLLLLGGLWMGIAQGFGLSFRHFAARDGTRAGSGRAVGLVIGAGLLAGLLGPTLAGVAEAAMAPMLFAGSAVLAAATHGLMVLTAFALPMTAVVADRDGDLDPAAAPTSAATPSPWLADVVTPLAWLLMAATMAAAPLGMAGCGIGTGGIVGAMAWHVVAMYAPALAAGPLVGRFGTVPVMAAGIALSLTGALLVHLTAIETGFLVALGLTGAGWSLATVAGTTALAGARRARLARHDALVAAGALVGALGAGLLA